MVSNRNNQLAAVTLSVGMATISLLASLLTLYLIRKLRKSNGYMHLVMSLTACQVVYDIGFYFFLCYNLNIGVVLFNFFNTWGGVASALWSNIIILVTCQIILNLRSVDIEKMYPYFLVSVFLPSITIASLAAIFLNNPSVLLSYFILRTVSIAINLIAIIIIFYKIYRLRKKDPLFQPNADPAYVLSKRLVYYCVIQTITRIGSSWYQLQYGFGSAAEYDASQASLLKSVIYLSEFILNPSAGIGYLIIFLKIQPDAWKELKSLFGCKESKSSAILSSKTLGPTRVVESDFRQNSTVTPLLDDGTMCRSMSESSKYYMYSSEVDQSGGHGIDENFRDSSSSRLDPEDDSRISMGTSSTPESLFPLLEMDEADLAREIDRRYHIQTYKW